ncbi:MAG: metalloregulator ArsR/SmtB family transcription factor [Phycisphaeraceae bacterium]
MTSTAPMLSWMSSLADATRTRTLRLLERHELSVAEVCAVLQLPQSTVSRHLKVLGDDRWVISRREGTSRVYRMRSAELEPGARRLWQLVREQTASTATIDQDERRLAHVLAERQTRSQAFFSTAAGQWDKLRREFFGDRFDLLALPALLDETWTIADLGCGTGQIAEALAPFVQQVIAVDSSTAMLKAARTRLGNLSNVDIRRGDLTTLPIDDAQLDAATIFLVLHHVSEPAAVFSEIARTLKPGGKLLIVDMLHHDRREMREQMGHVWLGFEQEQLADWLSEADFTLRRFTPLPTEPDAKGPGLFAAVARKGGGA